MQTPKKHGKGKINGQEDSGGFRTYGQPSPESKKAGWARKALLKELLQLSTGATFTGDKRKFREQAAKYMGVPVDDVTMEIMLHFRQFQKAIEKGDTFAYSALLDRAYGKPAQAVEQSGKIETVVTINRTKTG